VLASLFIILLVAAITILYCTSKHQHLLNKPLPKRTNKVGYVLFLLAALCAFKLFIGSAIVFSWLISVMVLTALIPLTMLLLFGKSR
jgi:membrane protein insertase Oxa1/YidC/SpoIIIJ